MKTILCLTLLFAGCASLNTRIDVYNNSTMSGRAINETYYYASSLFMKVTQCTPSRNMLTIKDATLKELNQGHNIFYYGSNGLSVGIMVGEYDPDNRVISFSVEHPDRQRILFHEMLHFIIHNITDPNCMVYDIVKRGDVEKEHFVIHELEKIYFVQTGRSDIGGNWIYEVLKRM